jgi:glycosyltransferase involved in cell wall biosynthesis
MRIVQINEKYGIVGGSEKTLRRSVDLLRERGHDVLVIHGDPEAAGEPGAAFLPSVRRATLFRRREALRYIARALREFAAEVVHFRNFDGPGVIRAVGRAYPTVRTVHTPWTYCPVGVKYWPRERRVCERPFSLACLAEQRRRGCDRRENGTSIGQFEMVRRLAACYAFREVDRRLGAVVVTSEWMKGMLVDAGQNPERVHVIPPPVDLPPRLPATNGGPPLVVAVGRVSYIKGFDDLLAALVKLPEAVTLAVVGDGPQLIDLKSLAAGLGLDGRVTFAGWVRYEEMAKIYRRAHVVALPSLCPEAFGNAGVEALSHGKPVVAYRVGGIPEWLEDGWFGLLAEPANVGDLARKLGFLLDHPAVAAEMGRKGWASVKRYEVGRHVDRTLAVYERAIKGFAAGGAA